MMFWFLSIIAPMTLLILTIYFYLNTWINSLILVYFNILVLIPIFILLAFFLIKPIKKDSKNRIHGTFEHRTIELISSYIKNILQENEIKFSIYKNYKRKQKPQDNYNLCYLSEKDGLEIGLSEGTSNKNATFVSIRYLDNTSRPIIEKIKNGVEEKANESLI